MDHHGDTGLDLMTRRVASLDEVGDGMGLDPVPLASWDEFIHLGSVVRLANPRRGWPWSFMFRIRVLARGSPSRSRQYRQ